LTHTIPDNEQGVANLCRVSSHETFDDVTRQYTPTGMSPPQAPRSTCSKRSSSSPEAPLSFGECRLRHSVQNRASRASVSMTWARTNPGISSFKEPLSIAKRRSSRSCRFVLPYLTRVMMVTSMRTLPALIAITRSCDVIPRYAAIFARKEDTRSAVRSSIFASNSKVTEYPAKVVAAGSLG
jgi:hypothetical protein